MVKNILKLLFLPIGLIVALFCTFIGLVLYACGEDDMLEFITGIWVKITPFSECFFDAPGW